MNNKLGTFITIIAVLIGGAFGRGVVRNYFDRQDSATITEELNKAAKEINKNCPQQIDEDTRLDKAVSGPGTRFSYYYTLVKHPSTNIDKKLFDKEIGPAIKKNALSGEGIRKMLKSGINVEYHYYGNDGIKISMVKLDPSDLN